MGPGYETTTDEVLANVDLKGKVAVITGGSTGLGAETARALASKNARVVITARDLKKAEGVARDIREATGGEVDAEELELGSIASIRASAKRILDKYPTINIIVGNAGVMACPYGKTIDGFETQFGVCHLGHFLFINLLVPALIRGAPSRVAVLSSGSHHISPIVFDDIQFERREYNKWASYGQAKTANALYALELQRRLGDRGVTAFSVQPGPVKTDLWVHYDEEDTAQFQAMLDSGKAKLKSVPQGAATSVYAVTSPELEGKGGIYLENCGIAEVAEESEFGCVRPYAQDKDAALRLWEESERLLGEKFYLIDA